VKQQPHQPTDEATASLATTAAVYARVSSSGQLGRDGDDDGDGYSIPAQVKGCTAKAAEFGATVAKAYVERAESARSDDRPVLQRMLAELPTLGVRYLIVHKVDRLARNRLDDALLYHQLQAMGITLVSACENIDETPAGRLMHGMLATFAEYYSNNLATEIKKGLHQKHATGGTPYRPPIGYLPVRKIVEGREVRTIMVDPERGPLITLAFDLYATGDWTLSRLTDHLRERGLMARPTPKQGGRPLSRATVHKLLSNPYYIKVIVYAGKRVLGRHDALIDPDTFDKVQALLVANRHGGDRSHKHEHFLRGMVFCSECGGRLLFNRVRGRNGDYYDYFSCANRAVRRRKAICNTGYYNVQRVEEAVERLYRRLHITDRIAAEIRQDVSDELAERHALIDKEAAKHRKHIQQIEANQAKLIQLYYKDLVSEDALEREQALLKEQETAAQRLYDVARIEAQEIDGALDVALERADRPQVAYDIGTNLERRVMTSSFFSRIEIGPDEDVSGTSLTPVYGALTAWKPDLGQPGRPSVSTAQFRPSANSVHRSRRRRPELRRPAKRRDAIHPPQSARPSRDGTTQRTLFASR
jgi:site-specific DNA recombinase